MSAAARASAVLWLALAGCGEAPREVEENTAAADVEALPPDESAATPTDELANGATEPSNADGVQY